MAKHLLSRLSGFWLPWSTEEPEPSLEDANGVRFADYWAHLPKRVADWPRAGVVKDSALLVAYHHEGSQCVACGVHYSTANIETHHIEGGASRSDERCNLIHLCGLCHDSVKTDRLPNGVILFLKWRFYPEETDWVRLATLRRRALAQPIPVRTNW